MISLERSLSGKGVVEAKKTVRDFFDGVEAIGISAKDIIELIEEEQIREKDATNKY
ncbi:MAG: hypothetical protein SVE93_04920 [Candidatus Thermoplasmatota archaeon]|nr:hypothetical protein [Candidatus Thermoplasmatota archaeon]